MSDNRYIGLMADLRPNIRLMRYTGMYMHAFSNGVPLLGKMYSWMHLVMLLVQFILILVNMALNSGDVNELSANAVTTLFFTHCITKFIYLALFQKSVYRTMNIWNLVNSHQLFSESDARYRNIAVQKMRHLLISVMTVTIFSVIAWITITFFGESTKFVFDKDTNSSLTETVPRLPFKSFYPWDASSGLLYVITFAIQIYYLLFSITHANLWDVLFCSWLIFACEQLQHLKNILVPLVDLSSTLDTFRPNSAKFLRNFAIPESKSEDLLIEDVNISTTVTELDMSGIYSSKKDWGANFRAPSTLLTFGQNPNGLSKQQEEMVRNAIRYWVERHKHVVRLVTAIGDTYGFSLLLHMLTTTINLTLLAYQATKVNAFNVYAFSTIGYLLYSFAQVFHFCVFGNRLIEESSSIMEAAYSCQWYNGSEEAKTFVQIVCQQCQKALLISGAKFFTVSLDLFASVLGAVVTYFMVLIQLS